MGRSEYGLIVNRSGQQERSLHGLQWRREEALGLLPVVKVDVSGQDVVNLYMVSQLIRMGKSGADKAIPTQSDSTLSDPARSVPGTI
jgi:hypothetical protein